ncbi:MAG TPA: hypothetical protein VHS57_09085, partial [Acidimicrobiales bacterium]|nr:hypothetical protein [Acidimicrobiales bacterium]
MRNKLLIGAAALAAATVLPIATATVAGGTGTDPNQATVKLGHGQYGLDLVVGGAGAGYVAATSTTTAHYDYPPGTPVYFATIDPPTGRVLPGQSYTAGCKTVVVTGLPQGNLSCTGAETGNSDWPALTTDAPPVASPGVETNLLGSVYRADLGTYQVTYAGHPLYLFAPGRQNFFGANFYETVKPLPPWHTAWYLLSPTGLPATGPATIETEAPQTGTTYSNTELAVEMLPNVVPGGVAVSAYAYSGDTSKVSKCSNACARLMIPVDTVGAPVIGSGVNASAVGTIRRLDGTEQVTYNGQPL